MRLTLFDLLEVKLLNSHIFMIYLDRRSSVKFYDMWMQIIKKEKKKMGTTLFQEAGKPFPPF